ncbi:MAG: endonuclease [bacterium]|nr:endonuclease [bacterium]
MRKIGLLIAVLTGSFFSFAQQNIADARTFGIGSTVTITGIATNGGELGPIRYVQDATAGLACYGGPITGVSEGDSVTVTGPLIEFSGLLEISIVDNVVNHGQAIVQPTPLQIPITSAGESLESQLVQIENVTFVQSGNFSGNTTYQITDGTNQLDVRVNSGTNLVGTAIPTGPVTITGPLGQFNANYQIVPRSTNDIVAYVAPLYEINVLLDGATVLHTSDYFIGNTASLSVEIENSGTQDLIVSGASFTGPDAADFSSNIGTPTIAGGSSQTFTINYAPSNTGSHFATLEIASNDADENPYIINFEGVGTDNLATEPTANPTGLTFPTIEAYTLNGTYAAGTGANNYLVLWKTGSPITGVPQDGNTYLRGDIIGDAKVAYAGAGTTFTPRGVIANQDYHFAVYAFNGAAGFENYLTTSPATANVTSGGENIGNYYGSITAASPTLHTDLQALINPHTEVTYFLYKLTMMDQFEVRDTTGGQSYVECVYSGERYVFDDPFDWTATGYSREHTFAHSWMPTFPADQPEEPEYNDQHNLYPANLAEANSPRSNLPLGEIDGTVVDSYLEGATGYSGSQLVYEPRDSHKGNAARAIFYMVTCYGFPLTGVASADEQDQDLLKTWHFNDLPDNREIARHEFIYNQQGNRNPYIDSTDWACFVNFDDFSYDATNCNLSVEDQLQNSMVVYPVPANEKVYVQVNGTKITSYEVIDMQGRVVTSNNDANLDVVIFNTNEFSTGSYIVKVTTPLGEAQRKMIVE